MPEFIDVDPGELYLPPGRKQGADPAKLARQLSLFGITNNQMPPLQVVRGKGGLLRVNDGVTRATRMAKFRPGVLIEAEVIQDLPNLNVAKMPRIKDALP